MWEWLKEVLGIGPPPCAHELEDHGICGRWLNETEAQDWRNYRCKLCQREAWHFVNADGEAIGPLRWRAKDHRSTEHF